MSSDAERFRVLVIKAEGLRVRIGKLLDQRERLVDQRARALAYLERPDLSPAKMIGLVAAVLKERI